jgi:pseudouridylate synthase
LAEEEQLDADLHERTLHSGLEAAEREGAGGKEVTPFLLEHFHRETGGASLAANVRLVLGNARLAAEIAVELAAA